MKDSIYKFKHLSTGKIYSVLAYILDIAFSVCCEYYGLDRSDIEHHDTLINR